MVLENWNLDTNSSGYTDVQSLVNCLDHRDVGAQHLSHHKIVVKLTCICVLLRQLQPLALANVTSKSVELYSCSGLLDLTMQMSVRCKCSKIPSYKEIRQAEFAENAQRNWITFCKTH